MATKDYKPDLGSPLHSKAEGKLTLKARLPNGTRLNVLRESGDWNLVRVRGTQTNGWIKDTYLATCSVNSPQKQIELIKSPGKSETKSKSKQKATKNLPEPPGASSDKPIQICWWNAKRLGHGERDWQLTAQPIKQCDIVALGEVMTKEAPAKLAHYLGKGWYASTSKTSVGTEHYREYYAVLYDSKRVSAVTRTIKGAGGFYPDPGNKLIREPWSISLKSGEFDFTLVLIHVVWGDRASERVAELEVLDDVYRWYQKRDPQEQDIILLGDFNRTPTQTGWEQIKQAGLKLLIDGAGTTINTKGEPANLYDQIIVDPAHTKEWSGQSGIISKLPMRLDEFRAKVSDHLPVWATFKTQVDDD